MNDADKSEWISALADGQLRGEQFARGVELACGDAQAMETWSTYHLIGDVMRSSDLAAGTAPDLFLSRLRAQLAAQAPRVPVVASLQEEVHAVGVRAQAARPEAANDAVLRWKYLAGFASVAAVAGIGWAVLSSTGRPGADGAQLAATTPPAGTVLAGSDRGVMIRDPRLDELLAAHRQLGGASALQSAGFLRNATYDAPGGR